MKRIVYLVGQISSDKRTYQWRKNIENFVSNLPEELKQEIELLNPCGNKMNLELIENHTGDEEGFNKLADRQLTLPLLAALDGGYVAYSNLCICNMNIYTPERPMIGSYFELSKYYYMHPSTPVIGILDGNPEEHYHTWHPFPQRAIHTWVKTEIEAIQLVLRQCFI